MKGQKMPDIFIKYGPLGPGCMPDCGASVGLSNHIDPHKRAAFWAEHIYN